MWGFGGNIPFDHHAFLEYVCQPDVLPSETKAYLQTTRAIKGKGGEMEKIAKHYFS
jgi:hypothetical protein